MFGYIRHHFAFFAECLSFLFGGVALFLPNINVFEWIRHHLHSSWNAYHFILGGVALFLPNLTVFECFRHQFDFLVECLLRLSCRAVISLSQSEYSLPLHHLSRKMLQAWDWKRCIKAGAILYVWSDAVDFHELHVR